MPESIDFPKNPNTYFLPIDDTEIQRVLLQDRTITPRLGPLIPPGIVGSTRDVLDIACGPGGWVLDVATAYPDMEVTGIDISTKMIKYAQAQQEVRGLQNVHFQIMDALDLASIPDAAFDFVNARTIQAFMKLSDWPGLVTQCKRITRPGGYLRLTESEAPFTLNCPTLEKLYSLILQMMWERGWIYSPTARHGGVFPLLGSLLRQGGWQDIHQAMVVIDIGHGQPAHANAYQDHKIGMDSIVPFLSRAFPQEDIAGMARQAMEEFASESFAGVWLFLSAWGQKS